MKLSAKEIQMTNYDIFMLNKNKKKAQNKLFDRQNETPTNISYESYKKKMEKKHKNSYTQDYRDYLKGQLERSVPERILTEQEFYENGSDSAIYSNKSEFYEMPLSEKANTKPTKLSRKIFGNIELTKSGKIFIAFYVLIVIAVASILIAVNSTSFSKLNIADAISNVESTTETVQPMVVEKENEDTQNWFDKLCDSLNK